MNVHYIDSIIRLRICPKCRLGMTREVGNKLYQCDHTMCGEQYDFSLLSDSMIRELLQRTRSMSKRPENKTSAKA